jgi:hypothetical protein
MMSWARRFARPAIMSVATTTMTPKLTYMRKFNLLVGSISKGIAILRFRKWRMTGPIQISEAK